MKWGSMSFIPFRSISSGLSRVSVAGAVWQVLERGVNFFNLFQMIQFIQILVSVFAVLIVAVAVSYVWQRVVLRRKQAFVDRLRPIYERKLYKCLGDCTGRSYRSFPMIDRPEAKLLLADRIFVLSQFLYGDEREHLSDIFRANGLDEEVLRPLWRIGRSAREYRLRMFTEVHVSDLPLEHMNRYCESHHPSQRIFALLARLNNAPADTLDILYKYPHQLSELDIIHICSFLRRHFADIDSLNFLMFSPNVSVVMLAVKMVRFFEAGTSVASLFPLLEHKDMRVRCETILTIMSMGSAKAIHQAFMFIHTLPAGLRKSLYRRLLQSSHLSLEAMERIADRDGDEELRKMVYCKTASQRLGLRKMTLNA